MSNPEDYIGLCETALQDYEKGKAAEQSLRALYNRLYYAAFNSAKAALLSHGIETKTRSGVADQVFKVLYDEKELIEREEAAILSRIQTKRDQSYYEMEMTDTEEDLEEIEPEIRDFIDKMKKIVEES